jgi:hypothetical protein
MRGLVFFVMTLSLALAMEMSDLEEGLSELNARDIKEIIHEKAEIIGDLVTKQIEINNVTKCIFNHETRVLNCHGFTGEVECPTVFETTGDLESRVFGLGIIPELVNAKVDQVRFWLYPRSLDNVSYGNHTVTVDGAVRDIVLYFGAKFVEYGLRVPDLKCYQRLVGLIRGSSTGRIVNLESDLPVKPVVSLIGEVLILDKEVSKRWLWGYGWGLNNGWGWSGLGYGYPYGLYGR